MSSISSKATESALAHNQDPVSTAKTATKVSTNTARKAWLEHTMANTQMDPSRTADTQITVEHLVPSQSRSQTG